MAKKPVVVVKPPKPVDEMTDEELDAFADSLFEMTEASFKEQTEN